jgi:hypothetical protein
MAKVKVVKKKVQLTQKSIVKFQLLTHCFIQGIQLSGSEVDCLVSLGICGEQGLSDFCNMAVQEKIFKTSQTVRNFITRAGKLGLVSKTGTSTKKIALDKVLDLQTEGSIWLDYNFIHVTEEQ